MKITVCELWVDCFNKPWKLFLACQKLLWEFVCDNGCKITKQVLFTCICIFQKVSSDCPTCSRLTVISVTRVIIKNPVSLFFKFWKNIFPILKRCHTFFRSDNKNISKWLSLPRKGTARLKWMKIHFEWLKISCCMCTLHSNRHVEDCFCWCTLFSHLCKRRQKKKTPPVLQTAASCHNSPSFDISALKLIPCLSQQQHLQQQLVGRSSDRRLTEGAKEPLQLLYYSNTIVMAPLLFLLCCYFKLLCIITTVSTSRWPICRCVLGSIHLPSFKDQYSVGHNSECCKHILSGIFTFPMCVEAEWTFSCTTAIFLTPH